MRKRTNGSLPARNKQTSWISVSCGDHSTQQVEVWITRSACQSCGHRQNYCTRKSDRCGLNLVAEIQNGWWFGCFAVGIPVRRVKNRFVALQKNNMMSQSNLRRNVTDWMRGRPGVVEVASALLVGAFGAVLSGGTGVWMIGWQAGIGLAVIGGIVGLVVGFFLGQLAIGVVGFILMVLFPSRRFYWAIASLAGTVGGFIRGQQLGYSAAECLTAAIAYAVLTLIVCESCDAAYTFFQRVTRRMESQNDRKAP